MDETCRDANDNTQRVWSFTKPTKRVAIRVKTHAIGFYAINGNSVIDFPESQKAIDLCKFLERIREANPKGRIVIVMDNFRSHHAKIVNEKANELNMSLIFLPPYSPDLNPIEFIWKSIKKIVTTISPYDVDRLKEIIANAFYYFTQSISFAKKWIQYFLYDKFKMLCT